MTPSSVLESVLLGSPQSLKMAPMGCSELCGEIARMRDESTLLMPYGFASQVGSIVTHSARSGVQLRREFDLMVAEWNVQSASMSSAAEMAALPSYQRIINMGRVAVPWVLEELKQSPDYWFWALRCITGENPVPMAHRGQLESMTEDWLLWGRQRDLVE